MPLSKALTWLRVPAALAATAVLLSACATSSGNENRSRTTDIKQVWSAEVDFRQPGTPKGYSLPAVAGRGDSALVVAGGRDAWAHIYNSRGHEVRRVSLKAACDSGAAVLANGLVVLGDTKGMLYGIDPQAGKIRWRYQLSAPLVSTPVPAGNGVLIQTTDNRLYRVGGDGKKRWSFSEYATGLGFYLTPSPLLHDHVVYAFFSNGDVVAANADSGDLVWRKQLLLDTDAAVLSELKAPVASPVYLPQLVMDGIHGRDVVLFPFYQGQMFALSRKDGSQVLRHALSVKSSPLKQGGMLYIAASDGSLQALDTGTGQVMWRQKLGKAELLGPVMWGGSLWVADIQGHVYRLDTDGHVQGRLKVSGRIDRPPLSSDLGVMVKTDLGALHLLR